MKGKGNDGMGCPVVYKGNNQRVRHDQDFFDTFRIWKRFSIYLVTFYQVKRRKEYKQRYGFLTRLKTAVYFYIEISIQILYLKKYFDFK